MLGVPLYRKVSGRTNSSCKAGDCYLVGTGPSPGFPADSPFRSVGGNHLETLTKMKTHRGRRAIHRMNNGATRGVKALTRSAREFILGIALRPLCWIRFVDRRSRRDHGPTPVPEAREADHEEGSDTQQEGRRRGGRDDVGSADLDDIRPCCGAELERNAGDREV